MGIEKIIEEIRQLDVARSRARRRIDAREILYSDIAINTSDGEVALYVIYHDWSYEAARYNPRAGREKKNVAYRYVWKPSEVKKNSRKKRSFPASLTSYRGPFLSLSLFFLGGGIS